MKKFNDRKKLWISGLVGLFLLGGQALPSFAQQNTDVLFLSGPKGTYISLVFDENYFDQLKFDPSDQVLVSKSSSKDKKGKVIAEISFPSSAIELRERLGAENTEGLMENLKMSSVEALYQKILSEPVDSLGLNLISPELQQALGLSYLDESWKEGETSHYDVKKVNSAGEVLYQLSHSISGEMAAYPQKFKLSEESVNDSSASFTWTIPEAMKYPGGFPVFAKLMQKKDMDADFQQVADGMVSPSMNGDSSHVYYNQPLDAGEAYSFYSVLYDAAGNESQPSDTTYVLSVSANEIGLITQFRVKQVGDAIALSWKPLPRRAIYTGIEISKSRTKDSAYVILDTIDARESTYQDMKNLKGSAYYYRVRPLLLVENNSLASQYSDASTSISYSEEDPAPSKPQGLRVEPHESGIRLSWWSPEESDIFGYYVLRGTDEKKMETIGEIVQDTVFIDGSFPSDFSGDMKYAVLAMNQNQQLSDTSDIAAFSIRQELVLTPPSGLATALTEQGVSLRWNDVSAIDDHVISYVILRRKKGQEKYDVVKTTEKIDVPFYTHNYKADGNTDQSAVYEYAIASQDLWGNYSGVSNSAEVDFSSTLKMKPPTEVQLRSLKDGIEVSWPNPYDSGEELYVLYRKAANEESFVEIQKVSPSKSTYFMDTTAESDVLYEYSIAVLKQDVEGEKSAVSSIRR